MRDIWKKQKAFPFLPPKQKQKNVYDSTTLLQHSQKNLLLGSDGSSNVVEHKNFFFVLVTFVKSRQGPVNMCISSSRKP